MAGLFKKILSKFSRKKFDWDELEETLISGDLGIKLSIQIIDTLQEKGKSIDPEDIIEACRNEIRS
ncbi:MAG: signal recognition particle receptor subunit alpha, partial [Verrucomicrobiota bacterium]|nr:signal recognition particle receptor subunit alpha [Verrucomicrobiota bacterium]